MRVVQGTWPYEFAGAEAHCSAFAAAGRTTERPKKSHLVGVYMHTCKDLQCLDAEGCIAERWWPQYCSGIFRRHVVWSKPNNAQHCPTQAAIKLENATFNMHTHSMPCFCCLQSAFTQGRSARVR